MKLKANLLLVLLFATLSANAAEPTVITLNTKARGAAIQSTMWGLFFEEKPLPSIA